MPPRISPEASNERRERILLAARWCFLNFGFAKTSLDDITMRAGISRTLFYRTFRDKGDVFAAVFEHWLVSRHDTARAAAAGPGTRQERLVAVCQILGVEPWADMVGAPMAKDFFDACDRLDHEISKTHHAVAVECATTILEDEAVGEVFIFAIEGQLDDEPTVEVFEKRIAILIDRFTRGD